MEGQAGIATCLLDSPHGEALLNQKGNCGRTPIWFACEAGRTEVGMKMTEDDEDDDEEEKEEEGVMMMTMMMMMMMMMMMLMMMMMMMMMMISYCVLSPQVVYLLLSRRADFNICDTEGKKPIDVANERWRAQCVQLLKVLEASASSSSSSSSSTPSSIKPCPPTALATGHIRGSLGIECETGLVLPLL
jgi:hypothetical protein